MHPPAPSGPTAIASWRAVSPDLLPACTAAVASGGIDKAWDALSVLATHFHYHQAQVHPGPGPCVCGAVSWQRPEPRNVGAGDAADALVAVIARRERRIRELCRLWPERPGALPVRVDQIWRALVEAAPLNSDWQRKLGALHSKAQAEMLLREAQEELRIALADLRQGRRDRWHTWCSAAMARRSGPLYRWIRNGPQPVTLPSAKLCGDSGACADLRATEDWWWNLWSPSVPNEPLVEQWLLPLERLTPFQPLCDISVEQLAQAFGGPRVGKRLALMGGGTPNSRCGPCQSLSNCARFVFLVNGKAGGRRP